MTQKYKELFLDISEYSAIVESKKIFLPYIELLL